MVLPGWIARTASVLAVVVVSLFAIAAVFAAIVVPYRFWDSLAFGSWSRSIAETGDLWVDGDALKLSRAPTPEDCRIVGTPGELVDAVFGRDLSYGDSVALQARALEVGFMGTKLERTGCSTFRVVVTGVPADEAVQADFARQAESVGLPVEYEDATRYPEVPSDVAPVAAR